MFRETLCVQGHYRTLSPEGGKKSDQEYKEHGKKMKRSMLNRKGGKYEMLIVFSSLPCTKNYVEIKKKEKERTEKRKNNVKRKKCGGKSLRISSPPKKKQGKEKKKL